VYNLAQYKLRESLKEKNNTIPNQLNKQVNTPTMRWIFQIMEGVGIVQFFEQARPRLIKECITNLNTLRKKIIAHFGQTACWMYGLIQKNPIQGLGI
jgi:transposase